MNNSKTQAKKMSKRLRKKYHIGEFTRYCARIVFVASNANSLHKLCNSDEFCDKLIDLYEDNQLGGTYCQVGNTLNLVFENFAPGEDYDLDKLKERTEAMLKTPLHEDLAFDRVEYLDGFYGDFDWI